MNKNKKIKKNSSGTMFKMTLTLFIICLILLISLFSIYFYVYITGLNRIYNSMEKFPNYNIAIIFGAGYFKENSRLSDILKDRVDVAIELYKNGKVKKLFMTGANDTPEYDEPKAMKDYAINNGVLESDIITDGQGFRTYDSIYRAKKVYNINFAILITQKYHLFRALYIANSLGLVSVGFASNKRKYLREDWYETREFIAVLLSFIEVNITKPKPKSLE